MPQRQNASFGSYRHVVAESNFVGSAIQQAAEVDDVAFPEVDTPRVKKATVHLDRGSHPKATEIEPEKRITNCARGQFADEIVVKEAAEGPCIEA